MKIDDIIKVYQEKESIKATARELEVSEGVVRKALITKGAYVSPLYEQIAELVKAGYSLNQIAEILEVSPSCVNANYPYVRGTYLDTDKSPNAIAIRKWRERKKTERHTT